MAVSESNLDDRLIAQNQRLLQHLNYDYACPGEIRQLLGEILGHPLDPTSQIRLPFYTEYGRHLKLGRCLLIEQNVTLADQDLITIESHVEIGAGAMLLTTGYQMDPQGQPQRWSAPITIKRGTKIGNRVIVQPGVTIGANSIIMAGAIVSHNIPANSVVTSN
ncbi:sugar O-acetyltransferase [Lapidilactobacillus achengensis]|uniref:Sugar O-acetyltransferase n=1 Tax=Lapidilactobacillus achengensis TaxID=2486000 RepID=A0ABW1USQ8_9LACO|nr:sugar O-acetyltransferase [Lapidilactobacillus achengensis]